MKNNASLPFSQELVTGPHRQPAESSTHPSTRFHYKQCLEARSQNREKRILT
jgi:hypothetical protein